MPLKKCSEGGKSGWKYGNAGKCYVGADSKKRAIKQGLAISGPDKFKQEMSKNELVTAEEIDEVIDEMLATGEIDRYDYYIQKELDSKKEE